MFISYEGILIINSCSPLWNCSPVWSCSSLINWSPLRNLSVIRYFWIPLPAKLFANITFLPKLDFMRAQRDTPRIKILFLGNKQRRDMESPDVLEQFVKLLEIRW